MQLVSCFLVLYHNKGLEAHDVREGQSDAVRDRTCPRRNDASCFCFPVCAKGMHVVCFCLMSCCNSFSFSDSCKNTAYVPQPFFFGEETHIVARHQISWIPFLPRSNRASLCQASLSYFRLVLCSDMLTANKNKCY